MDQFNQTIFFQWLEIVFSNQLKLNLSHSDVEKCFVPRFESLNYKEQVIINISLFEASTKNWTESMNVLCYLRSVWIFRQLNRFNKMSTPSSDSNESDISLSNLLTNTAFSTVKIVLLSIGATVLMLFTIVVLIMRIRNCMKRRTKCYKAPYSPAPAAIYQDFDLNPRSNIRRQPHKEMHWARYPASIKDKTSHMHNMTTTTTATTQYPCNCARCKLLLKHTSMRTPGNGLHYSCRPQCIKYSDIKETCDPVKDVSLKETSDDKLVVVLPPQMPRRRRHSLVDQIESVMNKHFDNTGIVKTISHDNLKCKSLLSSLNVPKSTLKNNGKFPQKFRKAISLRRRASIEKMDRMDNLFL